MEHNVIPAGEIHSPYNWRPANETARNALSVTAGDVGKLALQIDTGASYVLTDDSPATWRDIQIVGWDEVTGKPTFATVATSGAYSDLTGTPSLATVATTGDYADLTGSPALAAVATSGDYDDLTGKPTLGTVAALSYPGGTTTFLRADGTFATPAGGGGGAVDSVNGQTGDVVLDAGDIAVTPAGGISATDVQAALQELDTEKQPVDATLTALAGVTTSANKLIYADGSDSFVTTDLTAAGRAILDDVDAAAQRTTLGLGTLATQSGTFSGTSSGTNTGDQTSVTGNSGTATALQTARTIDGQSFDGTANITVIAPGTVAATAKTTPVDADVMPLADSAASNVLKKVTWANVKATLKTYFDTLYSTFVNPMTTSQDIIIGGSAGTPGRLGVGADGTFLGVTAGAIGWTTPSGSGDFVGPVSSTSGNLVSFGSTTGKLGADSGIVSANVPTMASNAGASGRVLTSAGTNKTVQDSGTLLSSLAPLNSPAFTGTPTGITATHVGLGSVTNNAQLRSPGAVTSGRTVVFSGTTGEVVAQSTRLEADLVAGPASSTSGNLPTFSGTGGKTLQDGGVALTNVPTMASNAGASGRVITSGGTNKTLADGGTLLSALATLASPTFTGTPAAPTASAGTSTTQLATTAFVQAAKLIEQNSQSTAYTAVIGDANKHLLHPAADTTARTFTIPANSSVAYPVGTTLTFVNQNAAGSMTIAITTDTMRLAGAGTTGSRTLAANGIATALKITSTEWIINGTGLT